MKAHLASSRNTQSGATLIVALVMLVLVTLVGIAMIRSTTMDEKMAGNSRDRDKAFQAAEAAVQKCLVMLQTSTSGLTLLSPATSGSPNWEGTWSNANSLEVTLPIENDATGARLAEQPRCMFETLGAGSGNYRVTGRARGGSSLTEVMLQATYTND